MLGASVVLGLLANAIGFAHAGTCPKAFGGPEVWNCGWDALAMSISNTFGFLGLGRVLLREELLALNDYPWLELVAGMQFFLGPVFLFFLGLALRNRYRMR